MTRSFMHCNVGGVCKVGGACVDALTHITVCRWVAIASTSAPSTLHIHQSAVTMEQTRRNSHRSGRQTLAVAHNIYPYLAHGLMPTRHAFIQSSFMWSLKCARTIEMASDVGNLLQLRTMCQNAKQPHGFDDVASSNSHWPSRWRPLDFAKSTRSRRLSIKKTSRRLRCPNAKS